MWRIVTRFFPPDRSSALDEVPFKEQFAPMLIRECSSPDATQALGVRFGELAQAGTVLCLNGPLGAGKTCFAQGVGRGLGVRELVTSPTFILLATYTSGRLPLFHADFYRLGDESELVELGLDEVLGREGIALIEWADRFTDGFEDYIRIEIEDLGPGQRRFTAVAHGPRSAALLVAFDE
jgi:tRNA threonylcarbamoyladenosine biosynthesis protein TsaE